MSLGKINWKTKEPEIPDDIQGVDREALIVHEKVHIKQLIEFGRLRFWWRYNQNPWKYERPAYLAQIGYLINKGIHQDRFQWLEAILNVDYKQTKEDVEDLLNEIFKE